MSISLPSIKLHPDICTPLISNFRNSCDDSPSSGINPDSPSPRPYSLPSLRTLSLLPSHDATAMKVAPSTHASNTQHKLTLSRSQPSQPESSLGSRHLPPYSTPDAPMASLPPNQLPQRFRANQHSCSLDVSRMTLEDHDEGYDSSVSVGSVTYSGLTSESSKPATPPPHLFEVPEIPESLSILAQVAQASLENDQRASERKDVEAAFARDRLSGIMRHQPVCYQDCQSKDKYQMSEASRQSRRLPDAHTKSPYPKPFRGRSSYSPVMYGPSELGPHRRPPFQQSRQQPYPQLLSPPPVQLKGFPHFEDRAMAHSSQVFAPYSSHVQYRSYDNLPTSDGLPIYPRNRLQNSFRPQQMNLASLKSSKSKPSSERPFSCPGCERTFARRYDRNRHARKHTGEKPYQCINPECEEDFGRPDALQRHYRAHPNCEEYRNKRLPSPDADSRSSDSTE